MAQAHPNSSFRPRRLRSVIKGDRCAWGTPHAPCELPYPPESHFTPESLQVPGQRTTRGGFLRADRLAVSLTGLGIALPALGVLLLVSLSAGCRSAHSVHDPDLHRLSHAVRCASHAETSPPNGQPVLAPALEGPQPVEVYIRRALVQNPEIHAARKQMEALAFQVPVAASLPDPMLNLTVQPEPVQTAAGEQRLIVSASQKVHWFGKLDARARQAESRTDVARARLAAVELDTVARVKRAYYELYFLQRATAVTEAEQRLLDEIRNVARARYAAGRTSQQDVLRADLEVSQVENELIRLRQQRTTAEARLARLLHLPPQTRLQALNTLPADQAPNDLARLQQIAVQARPELHVQLAAVERDRRAVELARLDYKPDVTLGFSWIDVSSTGISPVADGRDAFLLTAGLNLPVYQRRLEASQRSAEAQVVATARQYDAMRDETLEQVTDLFAQARSQDELLTLFREALLPRARQTLDVSLRAYNVGEVDFLQLVDNWRQLLRYQLNYHRLEASLRQSLAELEQVVGGFDVAASGTDGT